MEKDIISYLKGFVTTNRSKLFEKIIANRTRYITVAIEDVYQPHNASAVLRTCDCFGIHDVHIIENKNKYEVNPDVALGADKWLNMIKYNSNKENTLSAIRNIKNLGYRIVATTPHNNAVMLEDFDIHKGKFALLFGTELNGLSQNAIDAADEFLKIPMYGFTESFNISVSAAIILHHLSHKLRNFNTLWELTQNEQKEIMIQWLINSIKNGEKIAQNFTE